MGKYWLGFDSGKLIVNRIITNIDEKSTAYKVGLRNGMKVKSWEVPKGKDPDQTVVITTQDNVFSFRPEYYKTQLIFQIEEPNTKEKIHKINDFFTK